MFDWLNFDSLVTKPGKQGVVGLLTELNNKSNKCIFKVSQYVDYLSIHEYTVMKGLNDLMNYCPHFCRTYGLLKCNRNPRLGNALNNPFEKTDDVKYYIKEDVVLSEHIESKNKFSSYIKSSKMTDSVIISTLKQVLMAVSIAQYKKEFCHYDLHSQNIMMKKCNKDLVIVYILDGDNQIYVPTNGHYPVIIDFGFSYIKDLDDGPLWSTMGHTSSGFTADHFDKLRDPILLLTTVCAEMKEYRSKSKTTKILNKISRNMFGKLDIEWDTGWDISDDKDITTAINDEIYDVTIKLSTIFQEYHNYCIDILQTLVIIPVEQHDSKHIRTAFKLFMSEWIKIENQISFDYYNLYILKCVVDAARGVRSEYMTGETTAVAIKMFSRDINDKVAEVSKFCNLKSIDYDRLLGSLYILSNNIEGVIFDRMSVIRERKRISYEKLPLGSVEQVYAALESNIPSTYVFNDKTTVMLVDCITEDTKLLKLANPDKINTIHNFCVGSYIYDLYNAKDEGVEILKE